MLRLLELISYNLFSVHLYTDTKMENSQYSLGIRSCYLENIRFGKCSIRLTTNFYGGRDTPRPMTRSLPCRFSHRSTLLDCHQGVVKYVYFTTP